MSTSPREAKAPSAVPTRPTVAYIRAALQAMPPKFDPPTDGYLRAQGHDTSRIRPMGLNECLFPPSPRVIAAIRDNLHRINRYPDAQCPELGAIIAKRTGVPIEHIVWGNGSEELIKSALDLATHAGDHVILPVPTFWGYRSMLKSAEVDASLVPLLPDGTSSIDAMLAAMGARTRIVFCVTPNNPSGAMVSKQELDRLAAGVSGEAILFIDEAYHEFGVHAGGPDVLAAMARRRGPWIVVRTFSKAFAMAGMRIGYALCSDAVLADAVRKTTCVFNVPILAQVAACAAIDDADHLRYLLDATASGREQLTRGFRALGLDPLRSVGNFVSVALPMTGRAATQAMFDRGIQIHAWSDPGYERFIRVTVGTREDNDACLAALASVLSEGGDHAP